MVQMDDMTHRRAVSPVIATVILIAVAVAIGIAVAFWASGLTTSFSKYEQLGISAAYALPITNGWSITLQGNNTGSSAATIVQVQANGVPQTYGTSPGFGVWTITVSGSDSSGKTVASGGGFLIVLQLQNTQYSPGQTVEIAIVTASGTNYPKAIVLP
jgi:flagellin-like protein